MLMHDLNLKYRTLHGVVEASFVWRPEPSIVFVRSSGLVVPEDRPVADSTEPF